MLFETPIWIVWCGVASAAFIVGFGWGLLVNMSDKLRFGKVNCTDQEWLLAKTD